MSIKDLNLKNSVFFVRKGFKGKWEKISMNDNKYNFYKNKNIIYYAKLFNYEIKDKVLHICVL